MKIILDKILPPGFLANGISCGIKKSGKNDLGLIYSTVPAVSVGMFTTNKIQAAPVKVSKHHLRNFRAQAIIVNSGNANCSTGKQGIEDARMTAELVSKNLGINKNDILVASTGIIGKRLPIEKIDRRLPELVKRLSRYGIPALSRAIMTTDTRPKVVAARINVANRDVKIIGVAKGAGMIYPNMSTMLAFILTDININQKALKAALKEAVDKSFNSISIDGCMSTNDSVFAMANGLAQNKKLNLKEYLTFSRALDYVCLDLAKQIVKDGEGATKFIEIIVKGASRASDAKKVAFSVANSLLLKTAIFGENENWGRIIAAVGSCGLDIKEEKIKINFSPFKNKEIKIIVNLNQGKARWTVYTSDLSLEYVRINAEYN